MNILLIDDNQEITDLFETTLSASGHSCRVTNDGKEGLELIKKKESDIVLLDLAMPKLSGEDILKNLLKDGPIIDYNIYLVTASVVSEKEIKDFINSGVAGCLRKPLRLDDLLDTLQKHRIQN
ncbi:MAG: response regulator [Nitrosopumilus sp.]|nr:response regulator [Nitrosopumilus sp.]MDH3385488.1 response regulator [Nitrosopumilus sp.]